MIYLDSSVALAHLFGEGRLPPTRFWDQTITSSRLLEYEIMVRVRARAFDARRVAAARSLIDGFDLVEMSRVVLDRALGPFPVPVRTLDALHLATMDFLRKRGDDVEIATYDNRLRVAAQALGFPLSDI